jgi:predicted dinucleotide-binding enzyme
MPITRRTVLGSAVLVASYALVPIGWARQPTRIGIIGAGWLGGTVGRQWVKAGHEVMFASRNPEELRPMAESLGSLASVGTAAEAAAFGSILLFAVPYDALPELGRELKESIDGKIVLDACNPPPGSSNALTQEASRVGVGAVSVKYLPGTRLVRAFSAVDATAIEASAAAAGSKLGVPIAGDDAEALAIAEQLVRDAGCEPVVVGNLESAKLFQRGGPGFRANTNAAELRRLLDLSS